MSDSIVRSALISTDAELREDVSRILAVPERGYELRVDLDVALSAMGEPDLNRLLQSNPHVVIVDLADDITIGIRWVRQLIEAEPRRQIVAVGPGPTQQQLMSIMRAGVTEYLPKPVATDELITALDRLRRRLGASTRGSRSTRGRTYAVLGAKGGSGSTTTATNLAIVLHQLTGKRTLLVDLDFEVGGTAVLLGMDPRYTLADMAGNLHRMDARLMSSFIDRHDSGIHVLATPYEPDKARRVTGEQIHTMLRFVQHHFAHVVIDSSKAFASRTLAALQQADQIYLVSNVDIPSLRNIKRWLSLVDEDGDERDRIRLVVNRYDPDNVLSLEDVRVASGLEPFHILREDYATVVRSINTASPVIFEQTSDYAADVRSLGAAISGVTLDDRKVPGLLARFLRALPWRRSRDPRERRRDNTDG